MNIFRWMLEKASQIFVGSKTEQKTAKMIRQKESGTFIDVSSGRAKIFGEDYWSATHMLRARMNKKFPDNYHARLSSDAKSSYDYGEDRTVAIDAASIAIAMALRNGATVRQAAEAGAVSIGI